MQSSFVSGWERVLLIRMKRLGNDSVSRAQVFLWHKDFVSGRVTVVDKGRSRLPVSARSTNV
jgi:hypothetical protein